MKILISASNMVHINNFHKPYIDYFKAQGHSVYVMARGEGADFDIPFEKSVTSPKNLFLLPKIRKIIKKEKFDIIYLHTSLSAFLVRLSLKGLKNRPRVVNTVHGYLFGNGFSKLHNTLYLLCEKITKKQTDHILVMNNEDYEIATKNNLSLDGVSKIDGIGIDFSRLSRENKEEENTLVFVGELSKRKNQVFLVNAMKFLPNHKLILVGDGKERKKLEGLAKKTNLESRVAITGYERNVSYYINKASVYVSASKIEGLPFNILEAMYLDKPIVASNIKGHSDLLDSSLLFTADNTSEFVEKISNSSITERKYDCEKYSLNMVLDRNMSIYLSQLDKTRKKDFVTV